jgi:hypothetical protein
VEEVKARGPNFVFTKKYILQEYGPEIWARLLARLPSDAAEIWMGPPMAYLSYPFSAFKILVTNLAKEAGIVKEAETARLYEFIADSSLNVLYKTFFQLANPSFVIKNYPKLWSRFFETGTVEVPLAEKGHAIVKFILPEIFLDWISPACLGYSKKAVEMAGGRNLVVHQKSRSSLQDNLWEIIYELRWDE